MKFYKEKLRELRKKNKVSMEELAAKLKMHRTTIQAWENGTRIPTEEKIRMTARALNIQTDQISDIKPDRISAQSDTLYSSILLIADNPESKTHSQMVDSIHEKIDFMSEKILLLSMLNSALLSTTSSILYIKNTSLQYLLVNNPFMKAISLNENSLFLHKIDFDFFPKTEAEFNTQEDKEVLLKGKEIKDREGYIPGTRKRRWGIISKYPILDKTGKVHGIVGRIIDITERKQTEEKLSASQEKLRTAVKASNVGLWDWNLLTNEVYYSPEWKSLIGYEDHEIYNDYSQWESRVHPDDLDKAKKTVFSSIEKPYHDFRNEFRFRHKNGSYLWMLSQASLQYDTNGKPIRMSGSLFDITGQIETMQKLKTSERKLTETTDKLMLALKAAKMGSWYVDLSSKLYYMDGYTIKLHGFEDNDAGINLEEACRTVHPEDVAQLKRKLAYAIDNKSLYDNEYRVILPDGQIRWIYSIGKVEDSNPNCLIGIIQDITDRKKS